MSFLAAAVGVALIMASGSGKPREPEWRMWRSFLPAGAVRVAEGSDGGSVWKVRIPNTFVTTHRPSYVYLPRYRPRVRYPVLYLLHGLRGSPETFVRSSRIAETADGLTAAGKLRPLIVVMPVAGRTVLYDGEWAGPWEQFVVDDVVPWTDTHLPTLRSATGRVIGGLSAGGYGAVNTALRHPGLFGAAESWSGYFKPIQDGPFTHATIAQLEHNNPTILVRTRAALLRRDRLRILIAAGAQDPIDVARAWQFASELSRLRVRRTVVLRRGTHHDGTWRRLLPVGLVYAFPGRSLSAHRSLSTVRAGAAKPREQDRRQPPPQIARLIRTGLPVYCGGRHGDAVALTFDDGPGVYTRLALRILAHAHARATFFLVGRSIERFPSLPRREARLAALGDHTWTHPLLPALSPSAINQEIAATKTLIEHVTGKPVWLFRPPYAARSLVVDQKVKALRLLDVLWNVDSQDWIRGTSWTRIGELVVAGLKPGAIISMHENHGQTIRALRYIILPAMRRLHLHAVTVPQLIQRDPPTPRQLRAGYSGCINTRPLSHAG